MHPSRLSPTATKVLLSVVLGLLLAANMWCGIHILQLVRGQSKIKEDYAQVNSIRNGLLSVDVWKGHLQNIAARKLAHYKLTPDQEDIVKGAVEKAVTALIGELDHMMQQPQKTFKGKARKLAFKVFVDTQALSEQAPQYAQAVIDEVRKPANMEKIKTLALSQIESSNDAAGENAAVALKAILDRNGATSIDDFNAHIDERLHSSESDVRIYCVIMLSSLIVFLGTWGIVHGHRHVYRLLYTLSVVQAFILLLSALALPMIDIDARIKNVDFLLMGEHLQFTNQLLYFRSKSIMQMVRILLSAGKPQTILVGFLIFLFSIIFPVTKLFATLACLYGGAKIRLNKWVNFFAFHSGKWSMADVLVVAIFMTYIGFNGVLNDQLKGLNVNTKALAVITTNATALQSGFTLFLAFVLFGLALSIILKSILPTHTVDSGEHSLTK